MKKLILAFAILASANCFAQSSQKEDAKQFLAVHQLNFNRSQEPVYCENTDSLVKVLNLQHVNYMVNEYEFFGPTINEATLSSTSGRAVVNNLARPFVAYSIIEKDFKTYIIEVVGHNFF